jgi:hypothetical protein
MIRGISKMVSFVFHPLFIITYVTIFYLAVDPYGFGVASIKEQVPFIIMIFFTTAIIPIIAVLLMKFLGLVNSFELKESKERIGPYIITGIFYIWLTVNLFNNSEVPKLYVIFILGSAIGLFVSFFINNFSKISAHGVGMGGMVGFFLLLLQSPVQKIWLELSAQQAIGIPIIFLFLFVVFLTGIVGTSRLLLKAHEAKEVYQGILVGLSSVFFAMAFIGM